MGLLTKIMAGKGGSCRNRPFFLHTFCTTVLRTGRVSGGTPAYMFLRRSVTGISVPVRWPRVKIMYLLDEVRGILWPIGYFVA